MSTDSWTGNWSSFDLTDNSWEEIDTESFIDCEYYRVQFINRLPDGTIGIGAHCYFEDFQGTFGRIYQYDLADKRGQLFYAFDRRMILGELAFLDTMDTWVQENNTDAGLGNELTFVHIDGGSTRLVEDFERARSPVWLTPNMVVFFGTKTGPDNFETLGQTFAFFDTPWTLYSLDPQTGELRVLLNAVMHGRDIEEISPSNQVAFSGNINRQDGIWTFDLDSQGLTRIWADNTMFSWSPDGSKLIVLDSLEDKLGYRNPRIIQMHVRDID